MMAQYPSRRIAELSYRYRTLGLGYANLGALLMASGLGYDSAEGRAIAGAIAAVMTGTAYATSAEMAGLMGAFPGYRRQSRRHAAGDPQPSARRLRLRRRLRRPRHPSGGPRCRQLPRRPAGCRGAQGLGPRAGARREARLPQCPGLGHRPHRHDRPGDGLRHHRHRTRLRAGEVQEAGRRRLLQDHQPDRPAGARRPWATTRQRPPAASSPMRRATAR